MITCHEFYRMNQCDNQHELILYKCEDCPMCKINNKIQGLFDKMMREKELTELRDNLARGLNA